MRYPYFVFLVKKEGRELINFREIAGPFWQFLQLGPRAELYLRTTLPNSNIRHLIHCGFI